MTAAAGEVNKARIPSSSWLNPSLSRLDRFRAPSGRPAQPRPADRQLRSRFPVIPPVDLLPAGGVQARAVPQSVLAAVQLVGPLVGGRDGARLTLVIEHGDARPMALRDQPEHELENALHGFGDRLVFGQRPDELAE